MENLNPNPLSLNVITARTPAARQAALEAWKLAETILAKLEPYLAEEDAPRDTLYDILQTLMEAAQGSGMDVPPRAIDWARVESGAAWCAFRRAHPDAGEVDEVPERFKVWAAEVIARAQRTEMRPELVEWIYAGQLGWTLAEAALEAEAER